MSEPHRNFRRCGMKWIRPLSLALAVLAALPGLCQAQAGIWAPLSLPILFGQENTKPVSSDQKYGVDVGDGVRIEVPALGQRPAHAGDSATPADLQEFGLELGQSLQAILPRGNTGQFEWTAGQPTPCEPCKDLRQLVEA